MRDARDTQPAHQVGDPRCNPRSKEYDPLVWLCASGIAHEPGEGCWQCDTHQERHWSTGQWRPCKHSGCGCVMMPSRCHACRLPHTGIGQICRCPTGYADWLKNL